VETYFGVITVIAAMNFDSSC